MTLLQVEVKSIRLKGYLLVLVQSKEAVSTGFRFTIRFDFQVILKAEKSSKNIFQFKLLFYYISFKTIRAKI